MHASAVPTAAVVALMGIGLLAGGCGNRVDGSAGARSPADTLRGVVSVTGADPITRVVLRTHSGSVVLEGETAATLRTMGGLEVWVAGRRELDAPLHVDSFRVRGLDGMRAADGILESDGQDVVLVTADGERLRYGPAPPALRDLAGHHVWIAATPGRRPQQWGAIE